VGRAIQDSKQRTLVTSATVNWDLRDLFRIFMYESPEGERPDVRFRTATMTVMKEIMARAAFDAHVRHEVTTRGCNAGTSETVVGEELAALRQMPS